VGTAVDPEARVFFAKNEFFKLCKRLSGQRAKAWTPTEWLAVDRVGECGIIRDSHKPETASWGSDDPCRREK